MEDDDDFSFELDETLTEGDVLALRVTAAGGKQLQLWSEVVLIDRTATLRQFAIYGANVGINQFGPRQLREMAQAAMETFDVDCIRIEEARRTSASRPGRTVPTLIFIRRKD
jgi:hypothetical protein